MQASWSGLAIRGKKNLKLTWFLTIKSVSTKSQTLSHHADAPCCRISSQSLSKKSTDAVGLKIPFRKHDGKYADDIIWLLIREKNIMTNTDNVGPDDRIRSHTAHWYIYEIYRLHTCKAPDLAQTPPSWWSVARLLPSSCVYQPSWWSACPSQHPARSWAHCSAESRHCT